MYFDGLKDLLAQLMLIKQMAEGQDRGLNWDSIADQIDTGKVAHAWYLNKGLIHACITEQELLIQQVNAEHGGYWIRRVATLLGRLRAMKFDRGDERDPPRHEFLLSSKNFSHLVCFWTVVRS